MAKGKVGIGKGCLYAFLALIVISFAIAALAFVACVAAGVGLWFLIRYGWRKLVASSPDSKLVKAGMSMPPLARKIAAGVLCALVSLCLIGAIGGGSSTKQSDTVDEPQTPAAEQPANPEPDQSQSKQETPEKQTEQPAAVAPAAASFDYSQVPAFDGTASVQMNENVPYFTADDIQYAKDNPGYEHYGEQDRLARCTVASASVGKETMPAEGEERGEIGQIKPTGWHTVKYESVSGNYLYNRCHLIGWQLTDENSNINNLITGTRFLNVDGMLKYEDDVATYVKSTGNHVLYRVTPVFLDDDLVARGVLMEARSVEDDGAGLQFCVWAYNAQPGITIDYVDGNSEETPLLPAAGESSASGSEGSSNAGSTASDASSAQVKSYVLNTNTKKFHVPGCSSVKKMKDANRQDVESTRSDLIAQGYEPCQKCNP